MRFFLDHDWMHEMGEALPIYRPPLDADRPAPTSSEPVLPMVFRLLFAT